MNKKIKKPKFPRAYFKVPMGTHVIAPKKGKGSKDLSPYSRKSKHKKTTGNDNFDPVVIYLDPVVIYLPAPGAASTAA